MADRARRLPRPVPATRQGAAVLAVVQRSGTFRSAQDVHAELRTAGQRVGLATVYRHLQLLAENGVIDALQSADGQTLYRHCASDDHHHHLICRQCGTSVEIEAPDVEQWAANTATRRGYTDVTHTIEIFGVCPACRKPASRAQRHRTPPG
jgi:Fur family ferric uptake transcriptional regulator